MVLPGSFVHVLSASDLLLLALAGLAIVAVARSAPPPGLLPLAQLADGLPTPPIGRSHQSMRIS
jgi:hypothetical protein